MSELNSDNNGEESTRTDEGLGSLRPHSPYKRSDIEPIGSGVSRGFGCPHGQQWCPGPNAMRHGVLPCLDCAEDASDELLDAYRAHDNQRPARPRIGGGE